MALRRQREKTSVPGFHQPLEPASARQSRLRYAVFPSFRPSPMEWVSA